MPEQNKQTVRRLIDEFWNKQNFDVADQMFAPDAVYQTDGVTQSYAEVKAAFMQTRHAFPDMQVSIDDLLAEGDKVALRWTARGTHKNEFITD
jgi:predicted ester cyclase